jgi:hypothetical protein
MQQRQPPPRRDPERKESAMTTNVGSIDRMLRILAGLVLLAWTFGYLPGVAPSAWGWIGLVPLLTGLFGYCPAYALVGIDTCKRA